MDEDHDMVFEDNNMMYEDCNTMHEDYNMAGKNNNMMDENYNMVDYKDNDWGEKTRNRSNLITQAVHQCEGVQPTYFLHLKQRRDEYKWNLKDMYAVPHWRSHNGVNVQ